MLKSAAVALAMFLVGAASTARADCQLIDIGKLPIEFRGNQAFIPGKLRGEPIRLLMDTGAYRTIFDINTVKKVGMSTEEAPNYRGVGVNGEFRMQQAVFDDLEIGGIKVPTKRLLVNGNGFRSFAGVLGWDFFSQVDFELNFKTGEMKLFQAKGCDGAVLAYWAPDKAEIVDMISSRDSPQFPVSINGSRFSAVLDTGAGRTSVGRKVADFFGVSTSGGGTAVGMDARPITTAFHKFESFEIGGETIKNPTLMFVAGLSEGFRETGTRIEDRSSLTDVLVGFDFLRTHRVLVSNSQKKIFFTYEGGSVFPVPTAPAK